MPGTCTRLDCEGFMDKLDVQKLFAVTEVDLVYRNKVKASDRIKVDSSKLSYDVFISAWDMNKIDLCEQFMILLLDRSFRCIGISNLGTGGIAYCPVDPKLVFATALKARASNIIMAHNHPSGNLKPSNEDVKMTRKFKEAGDLLDISVLDHLILTSRNYFSFADEYLMPS